MAEDANNLPDEFSAEMGCLGPFEPRPRLAVAVSGGADSMALALLAQSWAVARNGEILALTVDHGLREEASREADLTLHALARQGVIGRKLAAIGLPRGTALAERSRAARYDLLLSACASAGIPHLLLGHHRGDQVETVMMRALSGSASRGLSGMPALLETNFVRLLRPLLRVAPVRLRSYLTERGVAWIEDPSNRDRLALRARLREARADPAGTGGGTLALAKAARRAGAQREERDRVIARILAERVTIRPEGYALLTPGPIEADALARLLQIIVGAPFAPPIDRVAQIARGPGPATLGGVRIVPAGRLGPGWLLVRERRAMRGSVAAHPGAVWDGRFRLVGFPPDIFPADGYVSGLTLDALDNDTGTFRRRHHPPAAVLHGLPAVRLGSKVIAVPHIGMGDPRWCIVFDPGNPACGAPFLSG
jgi:tRNA(Ile)-lysidine synthase